jgi:hypothetical protein
MIEMQKQQKEIMESMGEMLRNSQQLNEEIRQLSYTVPNNPDPYPSNHDHENNSEVLNDNRDPISCSDHLDSPNGTQPLEDNNHSDYPPELYWSQKQEKIIVPITSPLDYLVDSHSTLSEPTPDPPLRESTPIIQYPEDSNVPNEGDPKGMEDDQFWSQGYEESNSENEDTPIEEPELKIWSEPQGNYLSFEDLPPEDRNNTIKSRFLPSFENHPPLKQELLLKEEKQNNEKSMGDSREQNTSIEDLYLEKNDEFGEIGFLQNIKTDPPLGIIEDIDPTPPVTN